MNDQLEDYYCGDEAWANLANLYKELPNSNNTFVLKDILKDDNNLLLTKVIEGKVGDVALDWIYRKIPALNNLRPIDCIDSPILYKRLKTMLMRM